MTETDSTIKDILGSSLTGFNSRFDDDADLDMDEHLLVKTSQAAPSTTLCSTEDLCNAPIVCDDQPHRQTNQPNQTQPYEIVAVQPTSCDTSSEIEKTNTVNWSSYTPKMLKNRKSVVLEATGSNRQKGILANPMKSVNDDYSR